MIRIPKRTHHDTWRRRLNRTTLPNERTMVERVEQAVKFFHSRCMFDPVCVGRSFKSFNRNEIACACEKPNSRRQICRVTDPGGRRGLVSATFGEYLDRWRTLMRPQFGVDSVAIVVVWSRYVCFGTSSGPVWKKLPDASGICARFCCRRPSGPVWIKVARYVQDVCQIPSSVMCGCVCFWTSSGSKEVGNRVRDLCIVIADVCSVCVWLCFVWISSETVWKKLPVASDCLCRSHVPSSPFEVYPAPFL